MIKVSEFSSLNFRDDWKLDFQQNVEYVQRFLPSDEIRVQYITDTSILPYLMNHATGEISALSSDVVYSDELYETREVVFSNNSVTEDCLFSLGFKTIHGEVLIEAPFEVCMELPDTILLQYTNRRNALDTIFGDRFSFRVEGAFLPQEVQFSNDTEDFRDQRYVPKVLNSHAYEQKTLTLGGGFGVPNWVARKINLIFALSSIHVDGIPMVRSDGSSVEVSILGNYYPLYIYKIVLEESEDRDSDGSALLEYLRSVDEKKKLIRSSSPDDLRVYFDSLGVETAKMIRELDLIIELSDVYTIEIDDNTSTSSKRTSLKYLFAFWANYFSEKEVKFKSIVTDEIRSNGFSSGPLGSGHRLKDGELQVEKLLVTKELIAAETIVQRLRFVGGVYVLSPATGFKISNVEITSDYYRCYFDAATGYKNEFVAGDQARIQTYSNNTYLWSIVIGVGDDYIDLSTTDKDGNGIPMVGDDVVQLGNRENPDRQDAVLLTSVNGEVGIITYFGIDSFSLDGKEGSWLGKHNGKKGAVIKGEFYFETGENVKDVISKASGRTYKEYLLDLSTYNQNTYYPLVFPRNAELRVSYRVYHQQTDAYAPWSTDFFSQWELDCEWENSGGIFDYDDDRIVHIFKIEFTGGISPFGRIGKLTSARTIGKSQEYCYVRGGSTYRVRIPSTVSGDPMVYLEGYVDNSELKLPIYDLTELLTAEEIDISAIEKIIPVPVVNFSQLQTKVDFNSERLLLLASEDIYEGATKDTPIISQINNKIEVNSNGIQLLSQRYTQLSDGITSIQNELSVTKQGITAISSKITSLENSINLSIEGIVGDITSINQNVSDLAKSLDTLGGEFQEVKAAGFVTNQNFVTIFALKANSLGESMVSAINVAPEGIIIQGSKISLNGAIAVRNEDNEATVTIDNETGVLTAKGAVIEGDITAKSGSIGSFEIAKDDTGSWFKVEDRMGLSGSQLRFVRAGNAVYVGSHPDESTGGGAKLGSFQLSGGTFGGLLSSSHYAIAAIAPIAEDSSFSRKYAIYAQGNTLLNGRIATRVRSVTSSVKLVNTDFFVLASSSSNITLTLPDNPETGQIIMIRKTGSGNVIVSGAILNAWSGTTSSVTIDNGDLGIFVCNGTNWTSNQITNF